MITPVPLLSGGAVRTVDRVLDRLRVSVCTVQRPVSSVDESGAPIESYGTVAVSRCRVTAPQRVPTEAVVAGQMQSFVDYEVRLPRNVIVQSEDRILVNDRVLGVVSDRDALTSGFEVIVTVKAYES